MQLPDDVLARRARLPQKPAPVILAGKRVELRPLDLATDLDALFAVSSGAPFALGDRRIDAYDAEALIWRYLANGPFANPAELAGYLAPLVEAPDMLPMTVSDRATSTPLGVAVFMSNVPAHLKIELGHIWYGPIAQGTGASREATLLMCTHAFDLGYRRVEWKCNAKNERSRRAALSYGFTYEGTQEAHMIAKGQNRDTAWFRLLDHEWRARTM